MTAAISSPPPSGNYVTSVVDPDQATLRSAPEDAQSRSHHVKCSKGVTTGFNNPWNSWRPLKAQSMTFQFLKHLSTKGFQFPKPTESNIPSVLSPSFLQNRSKSAQSTPTVRATWLGHACFYVEFSSGLRVLFDPVFEDRCAPSSWLGPLRYTPVPQVNSDVSGKHDAPHRLIDDLPFVDAVVVSHNHYDHMSYPTLTEIKKKFPGAHFFAPLGNKDWFSRSGINNMTEMDWWDEKDIHVRITDAAEQKPSSADDSVSKAASTDITARISCLPCQHTSARTPFDQAKTLWSSWSVESGGQSVYFAGDTGYCAVPSQSPSSRAVCPAFASIGRHRGPFSLGLIPIGAYDPRHLMSPIHSDPHDAVRIFKDTRCKKALGMHWGTWALTTEELDEPPQKLMEALKEEGLGETGVFDVCDIGESREFDA